jgi:hypothetical protein
MSRMFSLLNQVRFSTRPAIVALASLAIGILSVSLSEEASAQFTQRPGTYIGMGNVGVNPWNGSVHVPGHAVYKPSGQYQAIGNGYYQNPMTGNKYNPHTGSYLQGSRPGFSQVEQRPGGYVRGVGGTGFNPVTGSVHIPGQAVIKSSGVYQPIGGGYYKNPVTGNTYNPGTGTYLRNW